VIKKTTQRSERMLGREIMVAKIEYIMGPHKEIMRCVM
jgi:hypothetical protein